MTSGKTEQLTKSKDGYIIKAGHTPPIYLHVSPISYVACSISRTGSPSVSSILGGEKPLLPGSVKKNTHIIHTVQKAQRIKTVKIVSWDWLEDSLLSTSKKAKPEGEYLMSGRTKAKAANKFKRRVVRKTNVAKGSTSCLISSVAIAAH